MYSTQPNGADSATINPAALASAELGNVRGIKRSRSPDYQSASHPGHGGDDDGQPNKKRGKPMKPTKSLSGISETPIPPPVPPGLHNVPPHASHVQHAPATGGQQPATAYQTPAQSSPPPKTTPAKSTLKALPTVRDHTTDQLGPGEDEYLPREFDEAGEKKVMPNGQLLGNREYRVRTFLVPNRGDKLFMLATECARVLGYRDSYLLFNKNRSLFKIIASQVEKDDLVNQEILPFSYRSRQIAIVTARSMFRQFGSRVITGGRRVRDDYWETKARKQGFTEADPAGEKRPGASKAREAAAEASQNAAMLGGPHGEIVYSNTPAHLGGAPQPQFVQPGMIGAPGGSTRMPVITPGPDYNDTRSRDYSSILKTGPRQEITGPAYQDRSQPTPLGEIHTQAHHAAEYNRTVNHQRDIRGDYMHNYWRRQQDQPAAAPISQSVGATDTIAPSSRPAPSSHTAATGMPQSSLLSSQSPQMMMSAPPYSQPISSQNAIQPPMRSSSGAMPQPQGYNQYPQSSQMWPQTPQTPQYSYTHPSQAQQSPHQQPTATPQMRGPSNQVPGSSMPYSGMPGMSQGYPSQGQGMSYDQTPRQYMHQNAAGAPAVSQSWSGQIGSGQPQQTSQWWTNQPQ